MAFLRIKRVKGGDYYYIMRSERHGHKVLNKILEYLGRDPKPAELRRALRYWRVKQKLAGVRRK